MNKNGACCNSLDLVRAETAGDQVGKPARVALNHVSALHVSLIICGVWSSLPKRGAAVWFLDPVLSRVVCYPVV